MPVDGCTNLILPMFKRTLKECSRDNQVNTLKDQERFPSTAGPPAQGAHAGPLPNVSSRAASSTTLGALTLFQHLRHLGIYLVIVAQVRKVARIVYSSPLIGPVD